MKIAAYKSVFIAIGIFFLTASNTVHKKPNILFIVADDLGYEQLGCYGNTQSLTPHLDNMAEEGILFERAYASPVCTPSRMSLLTGHYPVHHQYTNVIPVHKGTKEAVDFTRWTTYAQLLRAQGFHTAVTGKWQLGAMEFHPNHCRQGGFDSWCVWQIWRNNAKTSRYWESTYNHNGVIKNDIRDKFGPDVLTEYVIQEMSSAKAKNSPFLIVHNMVLPHTPIVETPADKSLGREGSLDNMIAYMDLEVGKLLNAVDSLGIADNTIIFFVGDNGTETEKERIINGQKVIGGKWSLHDGGIHVPLIVKWKKQIAPGKRNASLVDFTDFFPTFCELAGINSEKYSKTDGVSFANVLLGQKETHGRKFVTGGIAGKHYLFDGKWRFHTDDSTVYDCRNLPKEIKTDIKSDKQAHKAYNELINIWSDINH